MTVFNFLSKMALTILMKHAQNVELINSEHSAKTAHQNLFPFLRQSSRKFRTANAIENLIIQNLP